ncbi:MAG: (Fe-S)-binding protein [Thermodesulfobacteriota bacterium]
MSYIDRSDWSRCTECGQCLMQCPVLQMDKPAAVAAIRKLISGEPAPEVLEKCTFCFNCNRYCPVEGLRPHELILQRALEHRGKVPGILKYLANGRCRTNLFADMYEKLTAEEKQILEKWSVIPDSREILWIGCMGKLSCRDIDNSRVLAPLAKFGPPDLCCGELAYRLCSWEMYEQTAQRTLAVFSKLNIDRMVCYCGSCYNYFSSILPRVYGVTLPFKVISMYQWLWERFEKGELRVKSPRAFKAAVHESCYVTELEEDFADCLRRLYRTIGVETVELAHHGDCNLSCGAVSAVRSLNVLSSIFKEQRRKYAEVSDAGASQIAVNCPGCYVTLRFSNWMFGKKLRYMPDELLAAFGDTITAPLERRMPLIMTTAARRFPGLMFGR